jgi:hypothetical protein
MKIVEYQNGRCRCIVWELPDCGWEDVAGRLDPFLAHAILSIAAEYATEPVKWLEVNHWPDTGRLMVFPSQDGPNGNRGERIYFEFRSNCLENEFLRIGMLGTQAGRSSAWEEMENRTWHRVGDCLTKGHAARQLAKARKIHRFRIAAFDFCFGEGLFHLPELDKEATVEMQELLVRLKKQSGIDMP